MKFIISTIESRYSVIERGRKTTVNQGQFESFPVVGSEFLDVKSSSVCNLFLVRKKLNTRVIKKFNS
jgi:hypothetical protein